MLKVIITIDCDFNNYFPFQNKIKFNKINFIKTLFTTIEIIKKLNIPASFMIHTSIFIRKFFDNLFFTEKNFINIWKYLNKKNHNIGLHPHEEYFNNIYYYYYPKYIDNIIKIHTNLLNEHKIKTESIRFGYFTLAESSIPILEKYNIKYSFDNMRSYLGETSNHFEEALDKPYFYSYNNKEKSGNSKVLSIPLGMEKNNQLWNGLVPEANNISDMINLIDNLKSQNNIVNLLIHSYNSQKKYNNIFETLKYIRDNCKIISQSNIKNEFDKL